MESKQRDGTLKILHLLLTFCIVFSIACNASGTSFEDTKYPLEIVDAYGTTVTIENEPQRIISVMPSNTELLFAIGAGDNVVGGTIHDTYPPEAKELEKVGGYASLDLEKIIDLDPDLVIAGYGNGEENVGMMRDEFGMNVVVVNPQDIKDIMDNIELLGLITNNNENAAAVVSEMQIAIDTITETTEVIPEDARPRVLYIVWDDPMYAAGTSTFPSDLIEMAGGKNVLESEGWPMVDLEDIMMKDPQVIICSSMGAEDLSVSEELANKVRKNELLTYTSALKDERVIPISDPNLIEIPGPRIVLGLEELHLILKPIAESEMQEMELLSVDAEGNNETVEDIESNKDTPKSSGFGILLSSVVIAALYLVSSRIRK